MSKNLQITPHLSLEELEQRYRQAKNGIERSHYYIIWLLAQGKLTREVSELTGYSRSWVYELAWSYNRQGPGALGDKRHNNPGSKPLLSEQQQMQLWEVLQQPPADGGTWTGPKVADWMSNLLGKRIHPQRGWEYLRKLGLHRRRPRLVQEEPKSVDDSGRKKLVCR